MAQTNAWQNYEITSGVLEEHKERQEKLLGTQAQKSRQSPIR